MLVGVIAASVSVIAGVVVEVATDPETPLAVSIDTEDTEPGVKPSAVVTSLLNRVIAPLRVLNDETPPAVPLLALVILPLLSIVIVALVYVEAVTPVADNVVAKDPVPDPLISPVNVIV